MLPNFDPDSARQKLIKNKNFLFTGTTQNSLERKADRKTKAEQKKHSDLSEIKRGENIALISYGRYHLFNPYLGASLNAAQALEEENNPVISKQLTYPNALMNVKIYQDHKSIKALMRVFDEITPSLNISKQTVHLNQILDAINNHDSLSEAITNPDYKKLQEYLKDEEEIVFKKLSNGSTLRQEKLYERINSLLTRNQNQSSSLNAFIKHQVLEKTHNYLNSIWSFSHRSKEEVQNIKDKFITLRNKFFLESIKSPLKPKTQEEEKYVIDQEIKVVSEIDKIFENFKDPKNSLHHKYQEFKSVIQKYKEFLLDIFNNPDISLEEKHRFVKELSQTKVFKEDADFIKKLEEKMFSSLVESNPHFGDFIGFSQDLQNELLKIDKDKSEIDNFNSASTKHKKDPSFINAHTLLKSYFQLPEKEKLEKREELIKYINDFPKFDEKNNNFKIINARARNEIEKIESNQESFNYERERSFITSEKENILLPILKEKDYELFDYRVKQLISNSKPKQSLILNELSKIIIDSLDKFLKDGDKVYKSKDEAALDKRKKDIRILKSLKLLNQIYQMEDLSKTYEKTANQILENEKANIFKLSSVIKDHISKDYQANFQEFFDNYLQHLAFVFSQKEAGLNNKNALLTQIDISLQENQILPVKERKKLISNFNSKIIESISIAAEQIDNKSESYILNQTGTLSNYINPSTEDSIINAFNKNTLHISGTNKTWQEFFKTIIKKVTEVSKDSLNLKDLTIKYLDSFIDMSKLDLSETSHELEILESIFKLDKTELRQKAEIRFIDNFNELDINQLNILNKFLESYNKLLESKNESQKDSAYFLSTGINEKVNSLLDSINLKLQHPPENLSARLRLKELDKLTENLYTNFKDESFSLANMVDNHLENTIHQEQEKEPIQSKIKKLIKAYQAERQ